ncbi:MAG: hypothetical protein KKE50_06885 [Nanoarchaeota archaeon]|nr:hypothetical protein [Nanoarchaeota archaeon]
MQPYYHLTKNENVDRILKEGLRTGADLGHASPRYYGTECDNHFIYLSKTPDALLKWYPNMDRSSKSLLTLHLPDGHPTERDLDTHVIVSGIGIVFGSLTLKDVLQKMGVSLSIKEIIEISKDRTKIQEIFSRVPNYAWDNTFGFYRTPKNIPSSAIVRAERCDVDYVLNQEDLLKLIDESFEKDRRPRHVYA